MIRRILIWYLMLKKRLFKKTGFIVILLTITAFAFAFSFFAEKEGGGLLRVALAAEDAADEVAIDMMQSVSKESEIFRFYICDTPEEAKHMVESADADVAWVFQSDMENLLREVARGKNRTLATVYEPEESALLKMSREKLFGAIYPTMSYYMYEEFVTNELLPNEDISEEKLRKEYDLIPEKADIIAFSYVDAKGQSEFGGNYFSTTLRGLLLIMMLLAGIAATMYHLKDEEQGTYSWIAPRKRIFVSWGSNLAALTITGVFVTFALVLTGNYTSFWRETICMFLYILMATAFCGLLGALFRKVNLLCILLPTILVAAIVFCPVFFRAKMPLQEILPPYFYLYAILDMGMIVWMVLYCVIAYPLGYLINRKKK